MKKTLSLILTVMILLSSFGGLSAAAFDDPGEEIIIAVEGVTGDCTWQYDAENRELIIGGAGAMADCDAERPWDAAVADADAITVVIGAEVTYIGADAFSGLPLAEVRFSDGAVPNWIGERAFYGTGLTSVLLPSSVSGIGDQALGYGADGTKTDSFTIVCYGGSAAAREYCRENGFSYLTKMNTPFFTGIRNTVNGVELLWNQVKNTPLYRVYRKTAGGDWHSIAETSENAYTDPAQGLKSGTVYEYRVECRTADSRIAVSDCENEVKIRYIKAPKLISVSNAEGGQTIVWEAISGAQQYRVYRKTASGWKMIAAVNTTRYTNKDVKSGLVFTYTVSAVLGGEISGYDPDGLSETYCGYPVVSSIVNIRGGAALKWNSITGAVKYRVYRAIGAPSDWTIVADVKTNSYSDTSLKGKYNGQKIYYTIRPINSSGQFMSACKKNGWWVQYVVTPEMKSIQYPTNGLQLKWSAVKNAAYYSVYRKTNASKWSYIGKSTAETFTDTKGLVSGNTYTYTVRAHFKNGAVSGYYTAGWKRVYVAAPSAVKAVNSAKGVRLTWKGAKGAKYYTILRRAQYAGSNWETIKTVKEPSYIDGSAKNYTTYEYKIRCCDYVKSNGKNTLIYTSAESAAVRIRCKR